MSGGACLYSAIRLLVTANLVPMERWATAGQIVAGLNARGYKVCERTVQRDLRRLSGTFDLECDTRTKPYFWRRNRRLEEIT